MSQVAVRKTKKFSASYGYPDEYHGPKPISTQVDILAAKFGLSSNSTNEWVENVLPTLTLPDGAEGWFAFPSRDVVASCHFSAVGRSRKHQCVLEFALDILNESRKFYNCNKSKMEPFQFHQDDRTLYALNSITETQEGEILIIPAQFGMRHRSSSVSRTCESFHLEKSEFGLGVFELICMALTHPERYVRWEQLHTICACEKVGGEYGHYNNSPVFHFRNGRLEFDTYSRFHANRYYGSVTGFLL